MIRRLFHYVAAAIVVHFVWEMAQMWFFVDMRGLPLSTSSLRCLRATLGDLVITAVSYAAAAATARTLSWPLRVSLLPLAIWFLTGLTITIVFEQYAIETKRWTYAPEMPTIGGIGLLPILQWIVVPALVLLVIRFILRGTTHEERRASAP